MYGYIMNDLVKRGNSLIFVTHIEEFKNQLDNFIYGIRNKTLSKLK